MSDKRRPEYALPYVHTPDAIENETGSMVSQSLPMVGMFMRSKVLAWAGFFIALQNVMGKSVSLEENNGLSSLATSVIGVVMAYMDFVYVPKPAQKPA